MLESIKAQIHVLISLIIPIQLIPKKRSNAIMISVCKIIEHIIFYHINLLQWNKLPLSSNPEVTKELMIQFSLTPLPPCCIINDIKDIIEHITGKLEQRVLFDYKLLLNAMRMISGIS